MAKIIGIDLGTTNSVVAYGSGKEVEIIENESGNRTTPSVVSFKDDEILIGEAAKRQALTNPDTIISIKRLMGTNEVINIKGKEYKPEQISAMILSYLKEYTEKKIGEEVTDAIITVPAYFNDQQRQATKDAGKIAGLNVRRIINEPTAAALAYGLNSNSDNEIVIVYDLGGGTFDVSILQLKDKVFEVLATSGNNHLGGDDFDQAIMDWIIDDFNAKNNIDLRKNRMAIQRMKEEAEKAKKNLSSVNQTTISLPFIINDDSNPLHIEQVITREKFEELTKSLVNQTIDPITQALEDAGITEKEIDEIILVGGSTRIPAVREVIEKRFNKKPNATVNPDEVVAMGAAFQASLISGQITDIVLLDVTPLSLGVETKGGIMTPLIRRNTTIPASKKLTFTTVEDNQKQVEVKIFQGERILTLDNKFLGNLILDGIKDAIAGEPKIMVKFSIDENGIIKILVKDENTNIQKEVILEDNTNLTDAEIENMIQSASENKAKDEEIKRVIELVNIAEKKQIFLKKQISKLMENKVEDEVIDKYVGFSREYEYTISIRNEDKLKKYNRLVNDYLIEIEEVLKSGDTSFLKDKNNNFENIEDSLPTKKEEVTNDDSKVEETPKIIFKDLPQDKVVVNEEPIVPEVLLTDAPEEEVEVNQEEKPIIPEVLLTDAPEEEIKVETDNNEVKAEEIRAQQIKEEADKKAEEMRAQQAKEEADKKAEEAKAKAEADKKAEEAKAKVEADKKAEAEKKATEAKAKKVKAEAEKKAKAELERPVPTASEKFKKQQSKRSTTSSRVKNEELEILRKELDSLRLKNLELFEEMEDVKKEENE